MFKPKYGIFFMLFSFLIQPHTVFGFEQSITQITSSAMGILLAVLFLLKKQTLPETGISALAILFFIIGFTSSMINYGFEYFSNYNLFFYFRYSLNRIGFLFLLTRFLYTRKDFLQFITVTVFLATCTAAFPLYDFISGNRQSTFTMEEGRASGVFNDPNEMSAMMVAIFPLAYYLFRHSRKKYLKNIYIISLAALALAIFSSVSRGGLLGLLLVGFYIAKKNMKTITTPLVIGGAVLLFSVFAKDLFMERQTISTSRSGGVKVESSAMARIQHINNGFLLMLKNPVWGVSPRGTIDALRSQLGSRKPQWIHNTLMSVMAEYGLLGFAVYIAMYVVALRSIRRMAAHTDEFYRDLAYYLRAGLLGYMLCALFLSIPLEVMLLTTVALPAVLDKISQIEKQDDISPVIESG